MEPTTSSNQEVPKLHFDKDITTKFVLVIVYLSLLILVGSSGNILVSYIYGCRLRLNTYNFLYMCLGVVDLGCCFLGIPSEIALIALHENNMFCKMARFFQVTYALSSLCLLMIIALDRYIRVCRPLRPQMEVFHAKIGVAISVGLAVLLAIPVTVVYGNKPVRVPEKGWKAMDCSVQDKYLGSALLICEWLSFGSIIIGCTVFLAVTYILMWREIRKCKLYNAQRLTSCYIASPESRHSTVDTEMTDLTIASANRRLTNRQPSFLSIPERIRMSIFPTSAQELSAKIRQSIHASKSTKVALAVTVMFVLSFFPQGILIFIKPLAYFSPYQLTGATFFLYYICRYSIFLNAVANVFIYGGMSSEFRRECKQMLSCARSEQIAWHSGLRINAADGSYREAQS